MPNSSFCYGPSLTDDSQDVEDAKNKMLMKPMWDDLCPKMAYWFYGLDNFESSFEMAQELSERLDVEFETFLKMCNEGTLNQNQMDEHMEGLITGDGVIIFYDFSVSKNDILPDLINRTRQKLYEFAVELDYDGIPMLSLTGAELDKQVESLLRCYTYIKLGQYYFYLITFDDPKFDVDKHYESECRQKEYREAQRKISNN